MVGPLTALLTLVLRLIRVIGLISNRNASSRAAWDLHCARLLQLITHTPWSGSSMLVAYCSMAEDTSHRVSAVLLTEHPCGCYYETSVDEDGEVCLIRARTCTSCFDTLLTMLEREMLDRQAQLTLDLPLRVTGAKLPRV